MSNWHTIQSEGSLHVMELSIPDQVDAVEFDKFNEAIPQMLAANADGRWVLDLTRAQYTGSAMLGLMVNVRQRIKSAGGSLVLCGVSPRLQQILAASSLDRLFRVERARENAVKALS
jgi:anti-anti-sigma factor